MTQKNLRKYSFKKKCIFNWQCRVVGAHGKMSRSKSSKYASFIRNSKYNGLDMAREVLAS